MKTLEIEKMAFESARPLEGFTLRVYWLIQPKGDALAEIRKDGKPYKRFLYPAYKIYNLQAHWEDIVQSEINGDCVGYDMAGWTGFNVINPRVLEGPQQTNQGMGETPQYYCKWCEVAMSEPDYNELEGICENCLPTGVDNV
jgi:hypothetical protein